VRGLAHQFNIDSRRREFMVRSNNCRAHVLHLKVVDMVPVLIWSLHINAVGAELTAKGTAPRNVVVILKNRSHLRAAQGWGDKDKLLYFRQLG
jgi:hypothetical protein